jgi:hypothetical protein
VLGIKKSSIYVVNVGLWFAHDCFAAVEVSTAGKRIDGLEEDCMETQATVNYADGRFQPIIDKCEGCGRIVENENTQYCRSYVNPAAKWKLGFCNFATHAKPEIEVVKIRVNPLKAAKRASKRK